MQQNDLHLSIITSASPEKVFECLNNVTLWWTENLEGNSHTEGDEFAVRFGDMHYSKQKLTTFIPGKKVAWLVTESSLSFIRDKQECTNTSMVFDIAEENNNTVLHFTHVGLKPVVECFDACSNAWGQYIQGSLLQLINTGKGNATKRESEVIRN